jgi:hypothetical protein
MIARTNEKELYKITFLFIYAVAMALLEAAVVVYMRERYYPSDIRIMFPMRIFSNLDFIVELAREAATIVMMLAIAFVVERGSKAGIFACFIFLFGVWDLFYYLWLKIFINWPVTFFDWDLLFLIPIPWFGPWICPAIIAFLFMIWGGFAVSFKVSVNFSFPALALFITGALADLLTFLLPGFSIIGTSPDSAVTIAQPHNFLWPVFIPGFILMVSGLIFAISGFRKNTEVKPASS